jgi:hypothetical protein
MADIAIRSPHLGQDEGSRTQRLFSVTKLNKQTSSQD